MNQTDRLTERDTHTLARSRARDQTTAQEAILQQARDGRDSRSLARAWPIPMTDSPPTTNTQQITIEYNSQYGPQHTRATSTTTTQQGGEYREVCVCVGG
jgi:hypothetical protein